MIVQCIDCGHIINISKKVEEMVKLKLDNPKLEFHPTYYNQCPNCGCREVSKVQEQQQKQKYLKVSYLNYSK